ncbi:hypothetical protein RCH06_001950 [Polaromonas sp. CG_9.5]|uniref:type ISP restriction/modification enzyme n=1 Tax=Polaromonas sp. CG_9.5 TaxID=3071705 RepID=UPI002E020822|nr:hypothetical protein [Polaromonas sp. CG_9.5]
MAKTLSLETFLHAVRGVHGSGGGTKETSCYTALNNLLDAVGHALKPRVRCVMQLKNLGAGNPDGGLFTADQFDRASAEVKNLGAPARGVIEVKSPAEPVNDTATSQQISKYWSRYQLVLVTNLRDWLLIGERGGQRVTLERFTLAADEASFWALAAHPTKAQTDQGEAFEDFLARVLLHKAPLSDPKDLAALLASYAREARHRIMAAGDVAIAPLNALKASLEKALGLTFEGDKGEQFFRSTLVQTLFYGMFAAWVLQHESDAPPENFDWKTAAHSLHVPMVSALFEQLTLPSKLKPLNLAEVLDWAADALNRVDKPAFFSKFEADRAVQYFYEPFLEAFDPDLRRELGVWYTPEEIVRYQVARVDELLQTELGLPDGLADPNVVVLDPCCGTGAYLVEVLRLIGEKFKAQGMDAMTAHQLKQATTTRLFGFELLPAPYVVAHLQMGLVLRKLGAPLQDGERAGVYLTNSLTGWEPPPPGSPKEQIEQFPEIAQEREAAEKIKRGQPILVIIGNPPYNGYAGASMAEERDLSNAYRVAKTGPQPQGQGLNDLYVRFFRMAERQIAEHAGRGIVSYISNYSWLDGLSHPAMRERFLDVFDQIWIDNLHGDKYRTGKLTPEGLPDPSAFSTPSNREGIQVGTAIATLLCTGRNHGEKSLQLANSAAPPAHAKAPVHVRSFWGAGKRKLLAECDGVSGPVWQSIAPAAVLGHVLAPLATAVNYLDWPRLPELFPVSYPGVKTSRDAALIGMDRTELEQRMQRYFNPDVTDASIAQEIPALMQSGGRFNAAQERKEAIHHGMEVGSYVRYCYRPMDMRWLFWYPIGKLLDEKRPDYAPQAFAGNLWIFTTARTRKETPEPAFATHLLADLNLQDSGTRGIPLYLSDETQASTDSSHWRENLTATAVHYLEQVQAGAKDLFFHSLAVMQSHSYLTGNSGGLRQDWPRIPLPASRGALLASAALGRQVAALLDTETPVPGVTQGAIRDELKPIAVISRTGGGALTPAEFALTAGWGSGGQGSITMPGKGKTEPRAPQPGEQAAALGSTPTLDVYLNATACWKNVPQPVWDFTIGGYQVIKKWLSYREQRVLGRALTMAEIMEVTAMARRLAALVLLQPRLDENYQAAAAATWTPPAV